MYPILLDIGIITIHSYGFILALAFIVAIFIFLREARRNDIDQETILELSIVILISAVIGARLGHILLDLEYYRTYPSQVFNISRGGLVFHTGLIASIISGSIWCYFRRLSPMRIADIVAPSIPLGYAIGRIGCFLNGCCYGIKTEVPWAFPLYVVDRFPRHPVQLYSAFFGIIIFTIIWKYRDKSLFPGYLLFLYIGLYSIARFLVEFVRESEYFIWGLKTAQFVSIVAAFAAFSYIIWRNSKEKNEAADIRSIS